MPSVIPEPDMFATRKIGKVNALVHRALSFEYFCPEVSCTYKTINEHLYNRHHRTAHKKRGTRSLWGFRG